jgi:hypothetical protein
MAGDKLGNGNAPRYDVDWNMIEPTCRQSGMDRKRIKVSSFQYRNPPSELLLSARLRKLSLNE